MLNNNLAQLRDLLIKWMSLTNNTSSKSKSCGRKSQLWKLSTRRLATTPKKRRLKVKKSNTWSRRPMSQSVHRIQGAVRTQVAQLTMT